MKIMILVFIFSLNIYSNSLLDDLKSLENNYGLKFESISFKDQNQKETNILRDNKGQLQNTNDSQNFILDSEQRDFENFNTQILHSGGSRVGNGGDAIICSDRIEVLDSYRAKLNNDEEMALSNHDISEVIEKLNKSIPFLGKSLFDFRQNYIKRSSFSDKTFWSPETKLINIKDEQLMSELPKDCSLVQLVIRFKTRRTIFYYNKKLFQSIDSKQLSWILIHEWLWDYIEDSADIRHINHYLHSQSFMDASEVDIVNFFNKFSFNIKSKQLFSSNNKKSIAVLEFINDLEKKIKFSKTDLNHEVIIKIFLKNVDNLDFENFSRDIISREKDFIEKFINYLEQRYKKIENEDGNKIHKLVIRNLINTTFQKREELSLSSLATVIKLNLSLVAQYQREYLFEVKKYLIKNKSLFISRDIISNILDKYKQRFENNKIIFGQLVEQSFSELKIKIPNKFKGL